MDRPPWSSSGPTYQPVRRRSLVVRWLVVMLFVTAAAFAGWTFIQPVPDGPILDNSAPDCCWPPVWNR